LSDQPPTFDLQSHSVHSDGALDPGEVVAAAAAAGVSLLALTDHDTVDGVRDARAAAASLGIRLVPAVEISAIDRSGQDLHVLGYGVDEHDGRLLERLESYRHDRVRRCEAMARALGELGFELDEELLRERTARGESIGRPHLARAVVTHTANAQRLAEEDRLETSRFLEAYLIEGRPAFRPREIPTIEESLATIHAAGGVAVWAHPFWDVEEPDLVRETVERFRSHGLDGVECFYPTHSAEQTAQLADQCADLALLTTGSSDYHGPEHRQFNRFRAFSTHGRDAVLGPIAGAET
jgi:predicted metal-dependent phosphoesterase TrpH